MNLENSIFKNDFHYNNKFVNKSLLIIKFSKDKRRVLAYKNLVFRMMKDIVRKNMFNFINLLNTAGITAPPSNDDIITDCFVMFNKCCEKYNVTKNNNFYFYFNKSLSRNLFKEYKNFVKNNHLELTDNVLDSKVSSITVNEYDSVDIIMKNMHFNDVEIKICKSRLSGEKTSEFLQKNPEITNAEYSKQLRNIKRILIINKHEL